MNSKNFELYGDGPTGTLYTTKLKVSISIDEKKVLINL